MPREIIQPENHWDPSPNFSHVCRIGNMVFVAGQTPVDADGNLVGKGDIEAQTRQVFENIKKCLASVGATFDNVVKLNTYYVDDSEGDASRVFWEKMTQVRMEYIPDPGPAATAVKVAGLAYDGLVIEVEAIAITDG